ncbi:MAG TPA: 30S ribosomal protein S15 [Sunxiuqinia sp.]|nr:30S ribosomal protein S15 [Sunxiuqinia sp.]
MIENHRFLITFAQVFEINFKLLLLKAMLRLKDCITLILKIMYLTSEKKQEFFEKFGKSAKDTGSTEGQIALFSYRIAHLTEHLKKNKKDYSTQRALVRLVGKRRNLLDYLKDRDIEKYRELIKELNLRR